MSFTVVRPLVDQVRRLLRNLALPALLGVSMAAGGCGSPDPGLPHDLRFIGDLGPDDNTDVAQPIDTASTPDMVAPRPDMVSQQMFPMYAHDNQNLFRIEVPSFDLTMLGPFNANDDMTDLAVTSDGRIFTISATALYQVDVQSGQANKVTDVPGVDNVALGFLPSGELLASDKNGDVRRINPNTGAITEVGNYGNGYATAGDLVAVADGTLYGISDAPAAYLDNNLLMKVDPNTGMGTAIGPIGYGKVWGMAYNGGKVYAFTKAGEIIEINPDTGQGTLKRMHPVEFWGAGVSPLVRPQG
jgi:hypothetical protein